ncbi:uncharacterized protein LOC143195202 [Rhynchophorus ferrugineus]|uniref:uncharacterized protein LOC143195202 n=1 Tax=Rhynchophorus ferrugineus TaxID=354439 RepID=UPI003FCD68A7
MADNIRLPECPLQSVVNQKTYDRSDPIILKCVVLLQKKRAFSLVLQTALILVHVAGFVYSTYGKFSWLYQAQKYDNAVVKITDCVVNILLVFTNIYGLMKLSMNHLLRDITLYLTNKKLEETRHDTWFRKCILLLSISDLVPILINFYMYSTRIGMDVYRPLVATDLEFYLFNLIVFAVLCIPQKIREKLHEINKLLVKCSDVNVAANISDKNEKFYIATYSAYAENLKSITKNHNDLCDLLDKYNKCFKLMYCLIILSIKSAVLFCCTILIEFGTKEKSVNGVDPKIFVRIVYSLFIVSSMLTAGIAACVGEKIHEEVDGITRNCYYLLNKLPVCFKTDYQYVIEKQLTYLLDQNKSRNIGLCVGSMFTINWSIMGCITSTVVTYSIVIIQFLL